MVLGDGWKSLKVDVFFIVVDTSNPYNAITGRSTTNPNRITSPTVHQKIKLMPHGIG